MLKTHFKPASPYPRIPFEQAVRSPVSVYLTILFLVFFVGFFFSGFFCSMTAWGQEKAQPAEADGQNSVGSQADETGASEVDRADGNRPVASGRDIEEVGPEIYYVPDKNGKLRPAIFDVTFEQLKQRISELEGPSDQPPSFTLDTFTATGQARPEFADFKIQLTATNRRAADEDWVRIPLRIVDVILKSDDMAAYKGPGESFVRFDAEDGYVWWLRGGVNKTHTLTLNAVIPLETIGDERALRLEVPRAAAASLTVNVAEPVVAFASPGATLTTEKEDRGGTRIDVRGVAGEFELTWRRQSVDQDAPRAVLEADGLQTIEVMGSQIRSQINLRVQSFGRPFNRFRVQLPPGSRLISDSPSGYTVAEQENADAEGDKPSARWVDIKLEEMTTGPIAVQLVAEQIHRFGDWDREFQLAGFRVEDAVRESGHIVVQVRGDWIVPWREDFNGRYDIRRVDEWPEQLPKADVVAAFEYFRQPYSLRAKVLAPKTRLSVEPQFVMDVSADDVVLTGQLKYQVRGAKVDHVNIQLSGWEIDANAVGPADLVDTGQLFWSEAEQIHIPLARSTGGQFAINFRARRALDPKQSSVALPLPIVEADAIGATILAVVSADDVELTPTEQGDAEVSPFLPLSLELPKRQHEPYLYLYRHGEDLPEAFRADIELHQPSVAVDVLTALNVARNNIAVDQRFEFDISYGRLDSVDLVVPLQIARLEDFAISRDGQVLDLSPRNDESAEGSAIYRIPLINEIGMVLLHARYTWQTLPQPVSDRIINTVPLVTSRQVDYRINRLELRSSGAVRSEILIEPWQAVDETSVPAVYESETAESQVSVVTGVTEYSSDGGRSVDRGWVQTWLTSAGRHDRAVFRLRSREPTLALQLPKRTVMDSVEVRLNGKRLPTGSAKDGLLQIEVPRLDRDVVLDIRYVVDQKRASFWQSEFTLPQFAAGVILREPLHWQLILPANEHLLTVPQDCLAAYEWKWQRLGWRRVASVGERELADWSGATGVSGDSAQDATSNAYGVRNVYLFRIRDLPAAVTVYSAPRALMVLVPAGLILLLGYLLIYVPFFRRTGVLFTGVVGFAVLAFIFPELALLTAQFACLGAILSLLVLFLRHMLRVRPPAQVLLQRSVESSIRQSTTRVFHAPGEADQVGTTATRPAALGPNLPEPKS